MSETRLDGPGFTYTDDELDRAMRWAADARVRTRLASPGGLNVRVLAYALAEDNAEIRRHHELIAWMRTELEWACERLDRAGPGGSPVLYASRARARRTKQRLNREVG